MKIIFFGDSITDSSRERGSSDAGRVAENHLTVPRAYGSGYVFLTATELFYEQPGKYQILNRGIGGDRLPQLYARVALDVWRETPDVLSILIGFNDIDPGENPNPTYLERWGRVYRMLIKDTLESCPDTKIMILEPFAVRNPEKAYTLARYREVLAYAKEARRIAEEFSLPFVELQEKIDEAVEKYGIDAVLYDGTHPNLVGSKVISDAWLRVFRENFGEN